MNYPTFEPSCFVAGETPIWTKYLPDYLSTEGWSLKYFFQGPEKFEVEGVAQTDGSFLLSPSLDTSAKIPPGNYYYQAWATNDTEKHVVKTGSLEVKTDLSQSESGAAYDGRSKARQIIDAIDAMVEGKATLDQQEYMIGNRSLKRIPIPDLILLREKYAQIYARELRAAKLKGGAPYFKNILTRFDLPT